MAGKKKQWNVGTKLRYHGKALRVQIGIIPDPDLARQIAQAQTEAWYDGASLYHRIRDIAGRVMSSEDTFVPAPFRAPYYACVEEYYNMVVERKMDPDSVFTFLTETKYPNIDADIVTKILEALATNLPRFGPLPKKRGGSGQG